jgi:dipeptidyl aminopeptidase/acylaminoacyl peptidase
MRRVAMLVSGVVALPALVGCSGGEHGTATTTAAETTGELAAATTGTTSEIVFARGAHANLYIMRGDGSRVRLLVRDASEPAVSPDGRRTAFVRKNALWVMKRDGSGQRQLTRPTTTAKRTASDSDPAWSPDSQRLYFTRSGDDWKADTMVSSLLAIRLDGTNMREVTEVTGVHVHAECIPRPRPRPMGA